MDGLIDRGVRRGKRTRSLRCLVPLFSALLGLWGCARNASTKQDASGRDGPAVAPVKPRSSSGGRAFFVFDTQSTKAADEDERERATSGRDQIDSAIYGVLSRSILSAFVTARQRAEKRVRDRSCAVINERSRTCRRRRRCSHDSCPETRGSDRFARLCCLGLFPCVYLGSPHGHGGAVPPAGRRC